MWLNFMNVYRPDISNENTETQSRNSFPSSNNYDAGMGLGFLAAYQYNRVH